MSNNTRQGASIYSPLVLKLYDSWVLGISNKFAWQCSTKEILLPFFQQHLGTHHLDVGVGTGYYLGKTQLDPLAQVTLLDLNPNSLHVARQRLDIPYVTLIQHDVTTALKLQQGGGFDSISLFYLLHCLPGAIANKTNVLAHLKYHLKSQGVLYGATILGESANHNFFGRRLMKIYNRKGIFGNRYDTVGALEHEMHKHFREVRIQVHGRVALFTGKQPIH